MSDEQDVLAGTQIKSLLEHESTKAAFERLKQKFYADFANATSEEQRLNVWARHKALDDVQRELNAIVGNGVVAARALERKRRPPER